MDGRHIWGFQAEERSTVGHECIALRNERWHQRLLGLRSRKLKSSAPTKPNVKMVSTHTNAMAVRDWLRNRLP